MSTSLLEGITTPEDLKKLAPEQLPQLAQELRRYIIDVVATKEGHLGASLGVVELSVALHYVFNTPNDLLVWDVGHQAYVHKIITGRKDAFHTNRQFGGLSGFPKRSESEYDTFGVGHSSTSISAALGMAIASQLKGDHQKQHIAVIGDASIASGMAFEALNHAGVSNANLLIILNDNAIGIDPSVGALKEYLTKVKTDRSLAKNNIIKALNFDYSGPIDGHNLPKLLNELQRLQQQKGPRFLHVITTKGKGLKQAEEDQVTFHAPGKFDALTGEIHPKQTQHQPPKFQDVFGKTLVELASQNEHIVGITPAMLTGSSLKYMMDRYPTRTFDVGIAEQHAVTLAAGMATQGLVPFCVIYSTFLQRAYDQVIHDVALQNLPVIFCIDRAGLVGQDGATHHGVFDIAYLRCIPNMMIAAPKDEVALRNLMYTAQKGVSGPIAIRYPRGTGSRLVWELPFETVTMGKGRCLQEGDTLAVLSIGAIASTVSKAITLCKDSSQIAHYDMGFVKPLDTELLDDILTRFDTVICVEDGAIAGGFGSAVVEYAQQKKYTTTFEVLGIPDRFIDHGSIEELHRLVGIDADGLSKTFSNYL